MKTIYTFCTVFIFCFFAFSSFGQENDFDVPTTINERLHVDGTGSKLLVGAEGGTLGKLTVNAEPGVEIARFRTNGSTRVFISPLGDVGIGTVFPSANLDVIGDTEFNGTLTLVDGNEALGKVLTSDAFGLATWQTPAEDGDWTISGSSVHRATGTVGIGTTSPNTGMLHIKQSGSSYSQGIRMETSSASNEDWYTYMDANDDYTIDNDNSPKFKIQKNTGNVAIGTTFATGYRLSVDGKIATEELLIDLSGSWPDYVFSSDYDLMSIDEFAQSIEENKHLPGIPSAAEVEKDGVLVGDMQKRTMEKVEELSLYIIQLHERITALESENSKLKTKKTRRNK